MNPRAALGRSGEDLAAEMYARRGYRVLERNYRAPEGEVDLIVAGGTTIVFCEVKTRTSDRWGLPAEAVAWQKQARLRRLAARWMRERQAGGVEVRFDVVSIVMREGRPELTHFEQAF